jgi:hypothetical protein
MPPFACFRPVRRFWPFLPAVFAITRLPDSQPALSGQRVAENFKDQKKWCGLWGWRHQTPALFLTDF